MHSTETEVHFLCWYKKFYKILLENIRHLLNVVFKCKRGKNGFLLRPRVISLVGLYVHFYVHFCISIKILLKDTI